MRPYSSGDNPNFIFSTKIQKVACILKKIFFRIRERFEANWKPITIFEELPLKNITRSSFYRFLHRYDLLRMGNHQAQRDQRITPIIHAPGEALILDWGKVKTVYDASLRKNRTLWAFVGVLGCSRLMSVRLVWTNDVATTIAVLESLLKELGGVARRLTSDNPNVLPLRRQTTNRCSKSGPENAIRTTGRS